MTDLAGVPGPLARAYADPDAAVSLTLLARLASPALETLASSLPPDRFTELHRALDDAARLAGELASSRPPAPGFGFQFLLRRATETTHDALLAGTGTALPDPGLLACPAPQASPGPLRATTYGEDVFDVLCCMANAAYRVSLLELYEYELGASPAMRRANLAAALHALAVRLESAGLLDPLDPFGFLLARRPGDALSWTWLLTARKSADRMRC